MIRKPLTRYATSAALMVVLSQLVGCGGASANKVIAPQQSEETLRQETEAKIEAAKMPTRHSSRAFCRMS